MNTAWIHWGDIVKKCPFCKAEIEENARFCFYCMTSLEEKTIAEAPRFKKKYGAVVIAALFAVMLIVGVIIWWVVKDPAEEPPADQSMMGESLTVGTVEGGSSAGAVQNSGGATAGPTNDPNQAVSSSPNVGGNSSSGTAAGNTAGSAAGSGSAPGSVGGSSGDLPSSTEPSAPVTQPGQTEPSEPATQPEQTEPSAPATQPEQTEPSAPESTEPEDEDSGSTASPPATSSATYTYRDAQYAKDDYLVTANVDDCVVITGVETAASDGIYRIPSTLGGKKVIAVVSHAFSGENIKDTVKQIYLPSSVRTVHDYAFVACRNLTDIYFEANAIYVSNLAFAPKSQRTGTLTIHSAYNCSNRDFRYYRNIAESYYDAKWSQS